MKKRGLIIITISLLFSLLCPFIAYAGNFSEDKAGNKENGGELLEFYEKAEVITVKELDSNGSEEPGHFNEQIVTVKILSGKHKGKTMESINTLSGSPGIDINVKTGDKVVLYLTEENGELGEVYIADIVRTNYLSCLIIAFMILLIVIGGIKGLKALVALGFTVLAIYKVLLPALMQGHSPLTLTVIVLTVVTLLTMLIVAGFTRKSLAATLGTIAGVIIAGLLAYWVGNLAHLSGFATEESRMLLYVDNLKLDMRGLLFSGIIIGALGAIMDVAMSVASAVEEVHKANPRLSRWQLITAGMNVGRDIMGTMANTLILAYTGGALPFLLLYMAYSTSMVRVFNSELIATEVVRAIVGSIGLIFSVPITAVIAGAISKEAGK